jgi:hypothetical protein
MENDFLTDIKDFVRHYSIEKKGQDLLLCGAIVSDETTRDKMQYTVYYQVGITRKRFFYVTFTKDFKKIVERKIDFHEYIGLTKDIKTDRIIIELSYFDYYTQIPNYKYELKKGLEERKLYHRLFEVLNHNFDKSKGFTDEFGAPFTYGIYKNSDVSKKKYIYIFLKNSSSYDLIIIHFDEKLSIEREDQNFDIEEEDAFIKYLENLSKDVEWHEEFIWFRPEKRPLVFDFLNPQNEEERYLLNLYQFFGSNLERQEIGDTILKTKHKELQTYMYSFWPDHVESLLFQMRNDDKKRKIVSPLIKKFLDDSVKNI